MPGNWKMKPILPSMMEFPEYTIFSSSDDEGDDPDSVSPIKSEAVSLDTGINFNPSDGIQMSFDDIGISSRSTSDGVGSFVVSETPSRSLGSDSVIGSRSPSTSAHSTADFVTKCGNASTKNATCDIIDTDDSSIYEYVVALGNQPHSRSVLKNSDLGSFPHYKVKFLPNQYNGDAIYELPPILAPKEGVVGRLVGMDRSCDGHAWTEMQTSNLSDPLSCS
jgi:hypothetical protein